MSGIGDTIAVTQLAYKLYQKGFLIARDAPKHIRDLIKEVETIKHVLFFVKDKVNQEPGSASYSKAIRQVLHQCFETLSEFGALIEKYEILSFSDRGNLLKKVQWANEQNKIEELRSRLSHNESRLQLIFTAQGRAELVESISNDDPSEPQNGQDRNSSPTEVCPNCSARGDISQAADEEDPDPTNSLPPARTIEPFRPQSTRERHPIPAWLQHCFEKSHDSLKAKSSLESWLRLATWWLVKSRIILRALNQNGIQRRRTDTSEFESRWQSTVSEEQASLDLLKSCWIFEEIILKERDSESFSYVSIQKLATDLMRNIDMDLQENQTSVMAVSTAGNSGLERLNRSLLEDFQQSLEAESYVPKAIDDPSTHFRWIDVDQDNAGFETEKVVFRTFVNAQLGIKEHRSKSPTAPYLLLLWTTVGENDISLSLINQKGTLNLSRPLSIHDLEYYDSADTSLAPLAMDFPCHVSADIKFLNPSDVKDFWALPKRFFAAMGQMHARSEEVALLQTHLLSYKDQLSISGQWSTSDSLQASKRSSCGLRLYETVADGRWKVTRRLVISSAPDSNTPVCISHWLPPDKVEIQVDGTVVNVAWSNCAQYKTKSRNKTQVHYYGYDADHPNCKLRMTFGSSRDARVFADILLYPSEMPPQVRKVVQIERATSVQLTRVYRLEDEHEPDRPYSAVISTSRRPGSFRKSETFYVYKDIDFGFDLEDGNLSAVTFYQLSVADYISTKRRVIYPLNGKDPMPTFQSAAWSEEGRNPKLTFGCDHDLIRFMESLMGWRLNYYKPLLKATLIKTGGLRKRKEDLNDVCVQLWEKTLAEGARRTQLAIRLGHNAPRPWITASLLGYSHGSASTISETSIELRHLDVQRGSVVDEDMKAIVPGEDHEPDHSKRWKIMLRFREMDARKVFSEASNLV